MYKILDGNKACSMNAYLFSEICSVYPITPSSPMASNIDKLSNNEKNLFNEKVKLIEMQSEAGVSGCMHGALITGSLASTFTSSQGLLLMIPNMYKMAGEMLPGVIHVAARTIATHALSIFGDHSDIYATRQTGFCFLASTNVKDAYYMSAISHLSAIDSSLPFLHFFDGFRTSHEINKVDIIDNLELLKLVDYNKINEFRKRMLICSNSQKGLAENEDIYFQSLEARNLSYDKVPDIVNNYMDRLNKIANTSYKPFNYYGDEHATNVIVAMGSVCDTIKSVVNNTKNIGLIEVHLYRPFSKKYLKDVLPSTVKNIAVLDRTKESGSVGEPLYLDVLSSLKDVNLNIVNGRYGISSKEVTPEDINGVYNMLENTLKDNFTIGIDDDVTNLSIEPLKISIPNNYEEMKIYGFGSDGMVSASKDLLNIIGKNTEKFVQGYFEYDSKKSGGVTISHIRVGKDPIFAPYYVHNPRIIVITKEEYLFKYDMIEDILPSGIVVLNTNKSTNKLNEYLPNNFKKIIKERNIKLFVIDANKISSDNNLKNKISKIMETIILKLYNIDNFKELINKNIKDNFITKGEDIIKNNINATNVALDNLLEVDTDFTYNEDNNLNENIFEIINKRKGNTLKVSELMDYKDGTFPCSLTKLEKRNISTFVPKWNKEYCIQCNKCSLVCPHAVIRPFLTKDDVGIKAIGTIDTNFQICVSESDCTGCGLCVNACPGKNGNKALIMGLNKEKNLPDKENNIDFDIFNQKNVNFCKPYFEFPGACAGCGESTYIKLLTQLFGKKLIIANATGCSSIYGGSAPSTPYGLSWANSLFEDNAEFALGMLQTISEKKNRIMSIINETIDSVSNETKELYKSYLENINDYKITNDIKEKLINLDIPKDLLDIIDYIPSKDVWAIGGDGWAYDIGFSGIDHVLSSNQNINILVLDTEVYSNTGGQSSKSSRIGQVAEFANMGKKTNKKDLFKIAMCYPNVYVASVCFGSNYTQTINAFKEASMHDGPSIIIAYSPCIEQGIKKGNSISEQELAVNCGYVTLKRYKDNKLLLDSKEPNFDLYEDFLNNEVRYNSLKIKDEYLAKELLSINKENAINSYKYYKELGEINE